MLAARGQIATPSSLYLSLHYRSNFAPSHPCYTDSKASRGQKSIPALFFYDLPGGWPFLQLGLNPGDPGGKPLPGHNFIYCPVSLLAQHFWVY